MNQYSKLLMKGADEVRKFQHTKAISRSYDDEWLDALAYKLEQAGSLGDDNTAAREIDAIAHLIIDEGPLMVEFAPSFWEAFALSKRRVIVSHLDDVHKE